MYARPRAPGVNTKRLFEDLERLASLENKCGDSSLQDAIEEA